MGAAFGVGQLLVAFVLHRNLGGEDGEAERDAGQFAYEGLDRVIHERARLGVLTSLIAHPKGLAFGDLRRLCQLTDGNLSRHLAGAAGGRPGRRGQGLRAQPAADDVSTSRRRAGPAISTIWPCSNRWSATPPRR